MKEFSSNVWILFYSLMLHSGPSMAYSPEGNGYMDTQQLQPRPGDVLYIACFILLL